MTDHQLINGSEVEFWLYYIRHWQQNRTEQVPERAYQALEYARFNLSISNLSTTGDGQATVDAEVTIH